MSDRVTYAYAPDGQAVLKMRQPPPRTVRDLDTGRLVSGVREADLPRYGYYPEHRETAPSYGLGIEARPVIDVETQRAVYRARVVTDDERLVLAKRRQVRLAESARDADLRAWVASDASGVMRLYDISPARRADYIALPAMLDAMDVADPDSAPHSSLISVRDLDPPRDYQVPHSADQLRQLLASGMGYLTAVYQQHHGYLDAIEAAASLADVEAIVIPLPLEG